MRPFNIFSLSFQSLSPNFWYSHRFSSLAPLVADIFMERFETVSFESSLYKLQVWFGMSTVVSLFGLTVEIHFRLTMNMLLVNTVTFNLQWKLRIIYSYSLYSFIRWPFRSFCMSKTNAHFCSYLHANSHDHHHCVHRATQRTLQNIGYKSRNIQRSVQRPLNPPLHLVRMRLFKSPVI